jgi:hypothetical protein
VLDEVKWGLHEILVCSYHALNGHLQDEMAQICWRMVFFDEASNQAALLAQSPAAAGAG